MFNNFNSIENKKLLWQLLYENNVFSNISNNQIDNIKSIFEDHINKLDNDDYFSNVTEKNKKLIKLMIDSIKVLKINKNLRPLEEIEIKISEDYNNKKEEMFELLKRPTQKEIDFNEENDSPINNEEMDLILNEMIKNRNLENNSNYSIKEKKVNFNLKNNKIDHDKIDQDKIDQDKIDQDKIDQDIIDDSLLFLNKLKKEDNNKSYNNNIINLLENILEKQELILNIINNKYN